MSPTTIPQMLAATVAQAKDRPALGSISDGQLAWQTWGELNHEVQRFARALLATGVEPGDRVVQVSANRREWIVTDLAILCVGAVHVPLHSTLSGVQFVEQTTDCGAKLAFFSGEAFENVVGQLDPSVKTVCYDGAAAEAVSIESFLAVGEGEADTLAGPQPEDLATLLYTSGTTGRPRGVMLSHRNLTTNAITTTETVGAQIDEIRVCFLPLSHIYARTCDLYCWVYRGTRLALAESRETIVRDCQIVQPSVINGVPYFYQKVARPEGIRELLGGKVERCFCGGAAAAPEVERMFSDQGLPLLPGYGLTETSPVVSVSTLETYQAGAVGRLLPDVEVRIAEDGEILVRGPNVMQGYWQDEQATRDTIVDGWLHTGDLGSFDDTGNLKIVGRRKEIIVLSTGKNVAPTAVERLLVGSPLIEYACVVGDGQKCLGVLIVPNPEALRAEIRAHRLWVWSRRRAITHPRILQVFREEIDRVLSDASRSEQVGPFLILDRTFSVEEGEMTAKLSLRRDVIEAKFRRQIEAMFRG